MIEVATFKTDSERNFAAYLSGQNIDYIYEPKPSGPDFAIRFAGQDVLCEVTERRRRRLAEATTVIRRKIRSKSPQGKESKGSNPYLLVVQFSDMQNADLDESLFLETMFGAAQVTWSVASDGQETDVRLSFGAGARLQARLNTRFSAIASLQMINPTWPNFMRSVHQAWKWERDCGSSLSPLEVARVVERSAVARGDYDPTLAIPRLMVFHNPYAPVTLPSDLFTGTYNAQWNLSHHEYRRVAEGPGATEFDEGMRRLEEVKRL